MDISLIAVKVLWLVISSWLDAFPHHPVLVATSMQKGDRINHSFDLNWARVGTLRRMSSLQWMDGLGSWTTWLHWNWAPFLLKRWKYKCSLSQFCMLDSCNYRTLTVCRLFWISMTLVLQHLAINTFSWAKVGETLLWCRHDRSISIAVPKVTRLVQPASSLRQDISSGLHEGVHGMNHVCVCVRAYEGKTLICCTLTDILISYHLVLSQLRFLSYRSIIRHCRTLQGQCLQNGQWKHFKPIQVLTPLQLQQMFLDCTAVAPSHETPKIQGQTCKP